MKCIALLLGLIELVCAVEEQKKPTQLFDSAVENLCFPYKKLERTEQFMPVHQQKMDIISQESGKFLVVGSLNPCFGIVVTGEKDGKKFVLGAHWDITQDLQQETSKIKTLFNQIDSVTFYATKTNLGEAFMKENNISKKQWDQRIENAYQILLDVLKCQKSEKKILEIQNEELRQSTASYNLLVDSNGNIFNTCVFDSGIVKLPDNPGKVFLESFTGNDTWLKSILKNLVTPNDWNLISMMLQCSSIDGITNHHNFLEKFENYIKSFAPAYALHQFYKPHIPKRK